MDQPYNQGYKEDDVDPIDLVLTLAAKGPKTKVELLKRFDANSLREEDLDATLEELLGEGAIELRGMYYTLKEDNVDGGSKFQELPVAGD